MQKFVLDTNIFSELARPDPDHKVALKFAIHEQDIYLTSTVWQELRYGIENMAEGKKRREIIEFCNNHIAHLPLYKYDKPSAEIHAIIRAGGKKKGKTLPFADSQIASIALANSAVLVTRNVSDFADIEGLDVMNWFA